MSHAFRSLRALAIAVGAVVAIATHLAAQSTAVERLADSLRVAIASAVDAGELKGLDDAIALADRALAAFPDSPLLLHYRAYVLYEAGTLAIGRAGAAQARPYIEKARAVLEPLVKRETIAESYALLASVYGLQIGLSRVPMFAGMQLGPKSSEWMDRAVAAGPRNPRVWLLKGIGDIHTPKAFGGGSDKAEQHLKQALALFAVDKPAPPLPTWGLAEAHLWLGQVYAARGQPDSARAEYNLALALQPRNGWITKVLIPALAKIRR